jgi:hypothetical protein
MFGQIGSGRGSMRSTWTGRAKSLHPSFVNASLTRVLDMPLMLPTERALINGDWTRAYPHLAIFPDGADR